MQTRRDLVAAHRLMTQRAALALLCGDPDAPDQPLRRINLATVCGVLAAVIAAGVFAVLGLLGAGPVTGLTQPGTLVVDKDTATAYVPCQDGKLCPALNYASALLALGTANVNRVAVSQRVLAGYRIGPVIGIAGLPQDLPVASSLVKGPWSVCAQLPAMGAQPQTVVAAGQQLGGTPLGTGSAVLVASPQGSQWVIWDGQRLPVTGTLLLALFGMPAVQVPDAWLNALPQGPAFAAPPIPGRGQPVTGPGGQPAAVGQVYTVSMSGQQDFVLLTDGRLAPVTAAQAQLLERLPGAPATQPITPSQATGDLSGTTIPPGGLPATIPKPVAAGGTLCVSGTQVTAGATIPPGAVPAGTQGGAQADAVSLPAGHGALAGASAGPGQPGMAWFLISGATRYALTSPQVAQVLGYNLTAQAVVLPAAVLDLIPQGPPLDPGAATRQVPAGGTSGG